MHTSWHWPGLSVLQCNRTENAMHPVLQYVMHSCIRALANDDADDADDADDVDDGDGDGDDDDEGDTCIKAALREVSCKPKSNVSVSCHS